MVTLDNVQYKVRVKIRSLNRSFRIEESERSGAVKSGDYFRDIIGTYYDYEMEVEPDPSAPEDYDAFYEMISAPVESHSVVVPYGQGTMTYDAMVSTGDDTCSGRTESGRPQGPVEQENPSHSRAWRR